MNLVFRRVFNIRKPDLISDVLYGLERLDFHNLHVKLIHTFSVTKSNRGQCNS